jgi:hypothetical protein
MLILIGFGKPCLLACARRGAKSDQTVSPKRDYLLQSRQSDAIDVFGMVHSLSAHAERAPGHTLRPASRD